MTAWPCSSRRPSIADAARPRIHQGLPAGHPRERRPVHARRHLVGDRVRDARRRRQGRRAVFAAEPHPSRQHARRHPSVQGRALRGVRRRLRRAGPRRPRRMDLVHRFGGMDVSGRTRVDPRLSPAGHDARRSIPPCRGRGRASRSPFGTTRRATRSRSRTRTASAAACRASSSTACRCRRPAGRSPWPMTTATHHVRVILG